MDMKNEILKAVEKHSITAYEIAENTTLTEPGVRKILDGKTLKPQQTTLNAIWEYIQNKYQTNNVTKAPNNILIDYDNNGIIIHKAKVSDEMVPIINAEFTGGSMMEALNNQDAKVVGYVLLDIFKGSDFIAICRNDSLAPEINPGDWIGLKRILERDFFNYGSFYAFTTSDYDLVKQIKKSKDDKKIKLISINPKYEEFEIKKEAIIDLFIITASAPISKSIAYY